MIINKLFSWQNFNALSSNVLFVSSLLVLFTAQGFGQQKVAQLIELEKTDILAWKIPLEDSNEKKALFKVLITDELGENFQTEEDLHVRIGNAKELKYNINQSKKTVTLGFSSSESGQFYYKIYGRFRHLDGYWYDVSGSGCIEVCGGEHFHLYLLSLNRNNKTAVAFIQ